LETDESAMKVASDLFHLVQAFLQGRNNLVETLAWVE
jgi:hypothetical protein